MTCCALRDKISLIPGIRAFEDCNVPDSVLLDVMDFDYKSMHNKPILRFRFCPWCGKPYEWAPERGAHERLVEPPPAPIDES